ncbi:MAG: nuclear transport factor 2 family protein [Gemmatimonadota bacterium]
MRKLSLALTPILLAMVVGGCQPPPEAEMEPARTAQEAQANFDALRAEWQSLANADDWAAVAEFYTEDAVFTDVSGIVYNGREAIAGYFEGSLPGASDLVIQTADFVVHGDMAAAYGTFSQNVEGPEGPMPMSGMWQTVSLYQADGSLKIHLHQNMIPADMGPSM